MADSEELTGVKAETGCERRRGRRRRVLKRAQLIFGQAGSTIDCLVLDETPFGVQLETPVMTLVPEHLRIRFAGGETFNAIRLWSIGNRIGLNYVGSRIYDEESLRQRKAVRLTLETQGLPEAVQMLRDLEYFRSDDLRDAAKALELALERLSALLE